MQSCIVMLAPIQPVGSSLGLPGAPGSAHSPAPRDPFLHNAQMSG
jgi:hypothetical protein